MQYLLYIIDEVLMGQERGQRIYAEWDNGNAAPATAWMSRMARNYPELYPAMDVQRNRLWVPRVHTMLNANLPSMIVVGLYHLGPDSIVAQWRLTDFGFGECNWPRLWDSDRYLTSEAEPRAIKPPIRTR